MAGHNKWSQIQHQKTITDKKRSVLFSKILNAIAAAAKNEPNPQFNPRLRSLIEKARSENIPQENIKRAIEKTVGEKSEPLDLEVFGPAGVAMIIHCRTDNRNRTIAEIKHILNTHKAKLADPGGVQWLFEAEKAKFTQPAAPETIQETKKLIQLLENRPDVQKIITNLRQ